MYQLILITLPFSLQLIFYAAARFVYIFRFSTVAYSINFL